MRRKNLRKQSVTIQMTPVLATFVARWAAFVTQSNRLLHCINIQQTDQTRMWQPLYLNMNFLQLILMQVYILPSTIMTIRTGLANSTISCLVKVGAKSGLSVHCAGVTVHQINCLGCFYICHSLAYRREMNVLKAINWHSF